jgi:hypothetical protein
MENIMTKKNITLPTVKNQAKGETIEATSATAADITQSVPDKGVRVSTAFDAFDGIINVDAVKASQDALVKSMNERISPMLRMSETIAARFG